MVRLPERVDASNTKDLVAAVREAMDGARSLVVLDLAATTAIDSTALGAIVHLYKSLRVGEGDLAFANAGAGVRKILSVTRLDAVFAIHASVGDAIAARAARRGG